MSRDEVLPDLVNDLIVLQSHLREVVARQCEADALGPHWDARRLLQRLEPRLEGHVGALEECLARLGGRPARVKERLAALLGAAVGRMDRMRSERAVSRDLRDDYVFLSLVLVSYAMLRTAAASFGDEQTADLAGDHLDSLEPLADELTVLIPEVVEAEIAEDLPEGEAGSEV